MTNEMTELERWEAAAPTWVRNAERFTRVTAETTAALVDLLAPQPGERLLDLACGTGDPARALASAVGPTGLVVATDPIAEMAAAAATNTPDHVQVARSRAERLPFPDAAFDGLTCRFGAMFVDEPDAFASELLRVLRPGGRCVLVVWGAEAANPYFTLTGDALDKAGAPPAEISRPEKTVFEWAEPSTLANVLRSAGFAHVADSALPVHMLLHDIAPADYLAWASERAPAVADRLERSDRATTMHATALVAEHVTPWLRDGVIEVPAEVRLVSGRR